MEIFNEVLKNVNMEWVKGDTFTFLESTITVWSSKECGIGFPLEDYNGVLSIKYRKQDSTLQEITTISGEMIFTDNVITFGKLDLSLMVGDYFYSLKLYSKIDNNIVGTLLEGKFKVIN